MNQPRAASRKGHRAASGCALLLAAPPTGSLPIARVGRFERTSFLSIPIRTALQRKTSCGINTLIGCWPDCPDDRREVCERLKLSTDSLFVIKADASTAPAVDTSFGTGSRGCYKESETNSLTGRQPLSGQVNDPQGKHRCQIRSIPSYAAESRHVDGTR